MKRIKMMLAMFTLGVFAIGAIGCTQEKDDQFQEELNAMKQQIQREMDKVDQRIAELKNDAQEATEDTRDEIDQQMDQLEDVRAQLDEDLQRLANATKEQWKELKTEIDQTMQEVKKALAVEEQSPSQS